jgi:hypothetical protein
MAPRNEEASLLGHILERVVARVLLQRVEVRNTLYNPMYISVRGNLGDDANANSHARLQFSHLVWGRAQLHLRIPA